MGNISAEEALALSVTGPILRSTGVPWDLRRTMPYLAYDKLDFDVIVGTLRRQLRPLLGAPQRDPRVDQDDPPDRRDDAARATTGCRTARSRRRRAPASTRAWRRSSTTSRSSPRASGCPRARSTWPSSRPGASSAATWSPTGPRSRTACTSGRRASSTCRPCPLLLRGGLMADAVAVISSVDPVMGEVDR